MAAITCGLQASMAALALGPPQCNSRSALPSFQGLRSAGHLSPSVTTVLAAVPKQNFGGYRSLRVQAARVGGVEIPNAKRIEASLQYIHGVGLTTAKQILLDCSLENKYTKELSEEDLTKLRDEVAKYMVEGDLRRFNNLAIKRLKDIQCYRGRRHIAGLPCRGQQTKTNARTRRGGKRVAIAGKKKAAK
eukprot:TRINITY_DN16023_c0_g1_i1.p1 TRINITY_DN16023_c0_g1~~TRINITY_DN16023_c0_g1_i1.p1  ORF type:complete len:190 (+),score=45.06 TRINITY_DN16023_c0_g1_i1:50-619(+)